MPTARRGLFDWRKLVSAAVVAAGLLFIVQGFRGADTSERVRLPDELVVSVDPQPSDSVLRQSPVTVQLAPGYTGRLEINGNVIPDDELSVSRNANLSTLVFQPGEGKTFDEFVPGNHTVTIIYWRNDQSEEQGGKRFSWSFEVA